MWLLHWQITCLQLETVLVKLSNEMFHFCLDKLIYCAQSNQVLSMREVILELSDPRTKKQPDCVSVIVILEAAPSFYQP